MKPEREMCNKTSSLAQNKKKLRKKIKKKKSDSSSVVVSSKPFRRARTKIKKPKFLSLSKTQLQRPNSPGFDDDQRQLELFPVHPDHRTTEEDDDVDQSESMADHMFSEDGPGPTTLTGLLRSSGDGGGSSATSGLSYSAAAAPSAAYDSVKSARSLVRTAMRGRRERDASEEKWVSISEVVAERRGVEAAVEEEVTSGGGGGGEEGGGGCGGGGRLSLKLDYEEVLNAWSGKASFYVEAEEDEEEQTVPDLRFDQYGVFSADPFWCLSNGGQWSVPENSFNGQSNGHSQIGGYTEEERWKMGIREASLLRYKEKRQSRLFSKRIRYEVRKLNAEKRPRIKGRFVKRSAD